MRKLNGDHCQCTACSEYFNSTKAFDKHRRNFMCLSPAEMTAKGMAVSSTGWWVTSAKGDSSLSRVRRIDDLPKAMGE